MSIFVLKFLRDESHFQIVMKKRFLLKKIRQVTRPLLQNTSKQTQNKDGMHNGIILAIFKKQDDDRAGSRESFKFQRTLFFIFDMDKLGKNPLTPLKRVP